MFLHDVSMCFGAWRLADGTLPLLKPKPPRKRQKTAKKINDEVPHLTRSGGGPDTIKMYGVYFDLGELMATSDPSIQDRLTRQCKYASNLQLLVMDSTFF